LNTKSIFSLIWALKTKLEKEENNLKSNSANIKKILAELKKLIKIIKQVAKYNKKTGIEINLLGNGELTKYFETEKQIKYVNKALELLIGQKAKYKDSKISLMAPTKSTYLSNLKYISKLKYLILQNPSPYIKCWDPQEEELYNKTSNQLKQVKFKKEITIHFNGICMKDEKKFYSYAKAKEKRTINLA